MANALTIDFKVWQRALDESVRHTLSAHCLLTHTGDHLRDVDVGALAAAKRHNQRSIEIVKRVDAFVAGLLANITNNKSSGLIIIKKGENVSNENE